MTDSQSGDLVVRKCPKCGSPRIHRSRSRGFVEQLRKSISSQRPHRCHACGWRGWGHETQETATPEKPARGREIPDLAAIDVAVDSRVGNTASEAVAERK